MLDDEGGPTTKRDYEQATVPVGRSLAGRVVDYLGRPHPGLDGHPGEDASGASPSSLSSSNSGNGGNDGSRSSGGLGASSGSARAGLGSEDSAAAADARPQLGAEAWLPLLNAQVPIGAARGAMRWSRFEPWMAERQRRRHRRRCRRAPVLACMGLVC